MGFGGEWYRLVLLFFALCGETSRLRYHSQKNSSVKLWGLGQSPSGYCLLFDFAITTVLQRVQAMALAHRDAAANGDGVSVVDNPVHDGIDNGAVLVGIGVNAFIPAVRIVLGAEDCRAVLGPGLNDLQEVKGLLNRECAQQPLVQNQKIHLGIASRHRFEQVVRSDNHKLIQQLWHAHITDLLESGISGIAQRAGEVGLSAAGGSLEDDVVASSI